MLGENQGVHDPEKSHEVRTLNLIWNIPCLRELQRTLFEQVKEARHSPVNAGQPILVSACEFLEFVSNRR
jgi:hypothetical protein